jgi:hypothetical protein
MTMELGDYQIVVTDPIPRERLIVCIAPAPPTAAEVEDLRANAAEEWRRRDAATRLAAWNLNGFSLDDLAEIRSIRSEP